MSAGLGEFFGGPTVGADLEEFFSAGKRAPKKATTSTNGSRPITRTRRSRVEIESIRAAIYEVLVAHRPATVRQVFYQLTSRGVVDKTEAEYKGTVIRLMGEMRREGRIPYGWVADNTRWMRKPRTYSSLEDMLALTAQTYRRALWDTQVDYVEVWLEKEALAGVLFEVTQEWDVPLMVTRGYPSLSFLHGAAEAITNRDKPTTIYYFGDHDPSGVDISRVVERDLRQMAPTIDITFERVAVTEEQITTWSLPTRPTKRTDTRSQGFQGQSVEVDAIPAPDLRQLVSGRIQAHVDGEALDQLLAVEDAERETLETFARTYARGLA